MFGRGKEQENGWWDSKTEKQTHVPLASSATMPQMSFSVSTFFFQTMLSGHTCSIEHEGSWSHRTSPPRGATSTRETTQNKDKVYSQRTLAFFNCRCSFNSKHTHTEKGSDSMVNHSRRRWEITWRRIQLLKRSKEERKDKKTKPR